MGRLYEPVFVGLSRSSKEFVKQSAEMLRRFEKEGDSELKSLIMSYLYDTDSKREELEGKTIK